MAVNVRLSEQLVISAKQQAAMDNRSVAEQIEYWSRAGKLVIDNPDLPFGVIQEILIADSEPSVGEYEFDQVSNRTAKASVNRGGAE